ncbi:hypothetical protein B5S31_g316 [[Candida] boidinii]|nr:hypothetical protein B5S31_g316 [[Candida] boidinii]
MVQLYVVHPNLELSNCDSIPTDKTIKSKKLNYLSNLNEYNKLIKNLFNDSSISTIPNWCLTKDTNENLKKIYKSHTKSNHSDSNTTDKPSEVTISQLTDYLNNHNIIENSDSLVSSYNNDLNRTKSNKKEAEDKVQEISKPKDEKDEDLKFINEKIDEPIDEIKLKTISVKELQEKISSKDLLISKLKLPDFKILNNSINAANNPNHCIDNNNKEKEEDESKSIIHFLRVKYFQILIDLSLIEFKYLLKYSEINKTIKHYFSSSELTTEMEEEGFNKVNLQMNDFKILERILINLRDLKLIFEEKYLNYIRLNQSDLKKINNLHGNTNIIKSNKNDTKKCVT